MKMSHIVIKDVKQILYDRKLLIIILIMPIVLMTILGFSLKGMFGTSNGSMSEMTVAVVKNYDSDMDRIRLGNELKEGALAIGIDEATRESLLAVAQEVDPEDIFFSFMSGISDYIAYEIMEEDPALEALENKELDAVITLPEGFVYNSYVNMLTPSRNIVEVRVHKRTTNMIKGGIVESFVDSFMANMNNNALNKSVITDVLLETGNGEEAFHVAAGLANQVMESVRDQGIEIRAIGIEEKKQLTSFQYYAAAIMAMFVLYSAGYGGRHVLREYRQITLQRNQVAGVSIYKILASTFIMICVVSTIQASVMVLFTHFALKVYWGDFRLVALTVAMNSFAVGGIGLLVAVISYRTNNFKFANMFESAIIQVMALLGGSFVPIALLPKFMEKLSFLALNGVAIKMYTGIMSGKVVSELTQYIAILGGMGLVFVIAALVVMKTRREAV